MAQTARNELRYGMDAFDFVLLWVDGADPAWREEKRRALHRVGHAAAMQMDDREARYREWGLLRYWFRGVERFAPWVRTIHFVTWGHLPPWLNTQHPKLHIVSHADYIPAAYLPTFNSNTIEWNFHRIPGLSERFVLFNDDFFLMNAVKPTDFFVGEKPVDMLALQPDIANPKDATMPYIYLNNAMLLAKYFDKRTNMKQQPGAYFHFGYPLRYFGYNLLELAFPQMTGFYTVHGPSPLKKQTYKTLWQKEPELLDATCRHPFRDKGDVNQYALREWQKLSGEFVPRNMERGFRYFDLCDDNAALEKCLRGRRPKIVCLNDSAQLRDFEHARRQLQQLMEEVLPGASAFEKQKAAEQPQICRGSA